MTDYYPIVEVQPDWVFQPEQMGGKAKFWYLEPNEDISNWLFKYPRPNTGEHWAEKIAAEVAGFLQIRYAQVKLATFEGFCGSASRSFLSDDPQLFHGNQILAHHVRDYDPRQQFGRTRHTLENIWLGLDHVFVEPAGVQAAKTQFAEFLVLDAVIGNTDRHRENWGVVGKRAGGGWVGYLAPSFDHASASGRELNQSQGEIRRDMG